MRLIDADALNGYKFGLISPYAQNLFHKTINEAPTIVQEQRTGYWRDTGSGQECSECGEIQYGYDNFRKYCANCGAKMHENKEDTKKAIIGFTEFFKCITGNKDLKIPEDIAKKYGIEQDASNNSESEESKKNES